MRPIFKYFITAILFNVVVGEAPDRSSFLGHAARASKNQFSGDLAAQLNNIGSGRCLYSLRSIVSELVQF